MSDKKIRTYKVIALSVGGSNNAIYKSGDIVKENNFPPGNAEALVSKGFLAPAEPEKDVEAPKEKTLLELLSVKDLKEILSSKEIAFGNNMSKADLFALVSEFATSKDLDISGAKTKEDLVKILGAELI